MIFTLSGSIFLNLNTPVWEQNCKKPHPVWEQRIKKMHCSPVWEQKFEKSIPFWEHFAENDTRLGSKNGENYTLSSGTYPVPKTSKCPPPRARSPLGGKMSRRKIFWQSLANRIVAAEKCRHSKHTSLRKFSWDFERINILLSK